MTRKFNTGGVTVVTTDARDNPHSSENTGSQAYDQLRWDAEDESAIKSGILDAIPFEGREGQTVEYATDEFTSVCPWSGLPDFARLEIEYIPGETLVELKSLKYYLLSFRNVGILQEHAVARIANDLEDLLQPVYLRITGYFNNRGGLDTTSEVEIDNR